MPIAGARAHTTNALSMTATAPIPTLATITATLDDGGSSSFGRSGAGFTKLSAAPVTQATLATNSPRSGSNAPPVSTKLPPNHVRGSIIEVNPTALIWMLEEGSSKSPSVVKIADPFPR